VSKAKLEDYANRFYTLIPHDFGHNALPLIDTAEAVKKKMNLLECLIDVEIATNLMKESEENTEEHDKLVASYKSLKTSLAPLDKSSDKFKLLEGYVQNSQDRKQFGHFSISVDDIFEVERDSEKARFMPWTAVENRTLLWHGSRLSNWVGILSQGLRIAPPEAPKTGYRFGKGVYFADCISKSGSYCFTSNSSPTAVMLLAEVALGNINKLKNDTYMEKAPPGTHSTQALGMAAPDPKKAQAIDNGVVVPCGNIVPTGLSTACTHNEFIVYDVSQINIKYLLRVKFNHK